MPVRLRTGDGGLHQAPAGRAPDLLRLRQGPLRGIPLRRGAGQPDLCGRHLRGNAPGQNRAVQQHQRRPRCGLAGEKAALAGLHLFQGKTLLSGQLHPFWGRCESQKGGRGKSPWPLSPGVFRGGADRPLKHPNVCLPFSVPHAGGGGIDVTTKSDDTRGKGDAYEAVCSGTPPGRDYGPHVRVTCTTARIHLANHGKPWDGKARGLRYRISCPRRSMLC